MSNPEGIETPGKSGLILKEPTIFERSEPGRLGFELPPLDVPNKTPSRYARKVPAELPEVSELEVVRHFTRLSSWNYSIDGGALPLGSCTMKYNPRINEEIAALDGFANIHPDMPTACVQGALAVIHELEQKLSIIAGLDECSTQPAAGAQGEFTGLSLIRSFHLKHGSHRKYVLIPESAHGTNPASCFLAGYQTLSLPASSSGVLEVGPVKEAIEKHGREIAALMLTNPNTLGVFEQNILEISELLHEVGAQIYMDGANMNAIMGQARPGDMGVDVMQYNLHKTFSTPHGGGGPGAGPVAVRSHLAPYLPNPRVRFVDEKYVLEDLPDSIGKVKAGFGNFGVLVRALTYILHHGSSGLKQVSKHAVLNANYIKAKLKHSYKVATQTPSFHECVFTDELQQKKGVRTLEVAKALIDEGFHPPTVYFPLVVPGALLVEPTETESLSDLDQLISAFLKIAERIEAGENQFDEIPSKTIVGRVDEALAARRPVLSLDDRSRG